jgi:hypothetical protein
VLGGAGGGAFLGGMLGTALPVAGTAIGTVGKRVAGAPLNPDQEALKILQAHPAFKNLEKVAAKLAGVKPGEPITLAQLGDKASTKQMLEELAKYPKAQAVFREVATTQAEAAKALYTEAHKGVVQVTPAMRAAFADPEIQAAARAAIDRGKRMGVEFPAAFAGGGEPSGGGAAVLTMAKQMMEKNPKLLDLPGNKVFKDALANNTDEIPVPMLDFMNQHLAKAGLHQQAKSSAELASKKMTKAFLDDLLAEADNQVPAFGQARATAATYKQIESALRGGDLAAGKKLVGTKPEPVNLPMAGRGLGSWTVRAVQGPGMDEMVSGTLAEMLMAGAPGRPALGEILGFISQPAQPALVRPVMTAAAAGMAGGSGQ